MIVDIDFTPSRSEVSEKRLAANRANAQKSTGPRTKKGKDKSRGNAWQHGMCALKVVIPGEDPTPYLVRDRDWQRELNPGGSKVAAYLVSRAVLLSSRLDRCAAIHDARLAELARDAVEVEAEARSVRVDDLMRQIAVDPDVAARRLRQIPEGCDALIHEWDLLRVTLIAPWKWDAADELRSTRLLGNYSNAHEATPGPLRLPTMAIAEHREVAEKLRKNEHPDWITWMERYDHPGQHQHDLDRVDALRDKASRGRDYILAHLEAEVADLGVRRDELAALRSESRSEAAIRSRFDVSDAGKLIRRYEAEAERGMLKLIAEAVKLSPRGLEVEPEPTVAAEPVEAAPAEMPARNEPTSEGSRGQARVERNPAEVNGSNPDRPKRSRRAVKQKR